MKITCGKCATPNSVPGPRTRGRRSHIPCEECGASIALPPPLPDTSKESLFKVDGPFGSPARDEVELPLIPVPLAMPQRSPEEEPLSLSPVPEISEPTPRRRPRSWLRRWPAAALTAVFFFVAGVGAMEMGLFSEPLMSETPPTDAVAALEAPAAPAPEVVVPPIAEPTEPVVLGDEAQPMEAESAQDQRASAEPSSQSMSDEEERDEEGEEEVVASREEEDEAEDQAEEEHHHHRHHRSAKPSEADLPEAPSRSQVRRAMRSLLPEVRECADGAAGRALVRFVVKGEDGSVLHATVRRSDLPPSTRSCIARASRDLDLPPFDQETMSIDYPFVISSR